MDESVNFTRYQPCQQKGHYESFFQRANHPSEPKAFWIRYTIFSPDKHPEKAIGELWAIFFDGIEKKQIAVKKEILIEPDRKEIILNILKTITSKDYETQTNKMWVAVGCKLCNETGYKGRIGIYEAILTNSKIENTIREIPSEREISIAAADQDILNMQQDGIIKVLKGITSIDELERVVSLEVVPLEILPEILSF